MMKRFLGLTLVLLLSSAYLSGIAPYYHITTLSGSMEKASEKVSALLTGNGYDVIGTYTPGGNPDLYVIVFTNEKIKSLCLRSGNRGMLAAAMKVGLQKREGKIAVSMVNPQYLFYAYLREKMHENAFKSTALGIDTEIKRTMKSMGSSMKSFGGDIDADKLIKYRYMMGMPDFGDPVKLAEFRSFQEGLATIRRNLTSGKNKTVRVYEIVEADRKIVVIGVGLKSKEEGEAHFLPIIGESHVAAMPYEIILQGNKATMLHGRYRFALLWPELTMKTFTKIMSSPGDVEDAMKELVD